MFHSVSWRELHCGHGAHRFVLVDYPNHYFVGQGRVGCSRKESAANCTFFPRRVHFALDLSFFGGDLGKMRIALGIEYNGAGFCGWQIQQNAAVRTVQGCVERALAVVANQPLRIHCAGRTDTGVHAIEQIIHFDAPVERSMHSWVFGANANLPHDISVLWAQTVRDDFHARFSALRRSYRYIIFNRQVRPAITNQRVTWDYRALDVSRMQAAASHLLGEHDFSSFRAYACQASSPTRTVTQLVVQRIGEHIIIDIEANAFLHHMVRNIAGVLMAIGAGEHEVDWIADVLAARDRQLGGVTAVADGLYLTRVTYAVEFGLTHRPLPQPIPEQVLPLDLPASHGSR